MRFVRQVGAACYAVAHFLQAKDLKLESDRQQLQDQLQEAQQLTQQLRGEVGRMQPELQQLQQQLLQIQEAKQEAEARVQDLSTELEVCQTHHLWPCNSHTTSDESVALDSAGPHHMVLDAVQEQSGSCCLFC